MTTANAPLAVKIASEYRRLGGAASMGSSLVSPLTPRSELNKLPSFTWPVRTPTVGGEPGPYLHVDKTLVQIDAEVVGTGSVTFNVEIRSVMGVPDTELLISDVVATSTAVQVTTFAVTALPRGKRFWLNIKNVTGTVDYLAITVTTTGGATNGTTGGGGAGTGNVSDAGSTTDGNVVVWVDGANSHILGDGGPLPDMFKSIYDTDDDGIVDEAKSADALRGNSIDPTLSLNDGQILKWNANTNLFEAADEAGGGSASVPSGLQIYLNSILR